MDGGAEYIYFVPTFIHCVSYINFQARKQVPVPWYQQGPDSEGYSVCNGPTKL